MISGLRQRSADSFLVSKKANPGRAESSGNTRPGLKELLPENCKEKAEATAHTQWTICTRQGSTEPAARHSNSISQNTPCSRQDMSGALRTVTSSFLSCGISQINFSCSNSTVTVWCGSEYQRDWDSKIWDIYAKQYVSIASEKTWSEGKSPSSTSSVVKQICHMTQKFHS